MLGQTEIYVVLMLVGILVFLLLCREIFCWYWKINKMCKILANQTAELSEIKSYLKSLVAYEEEKKGRALKNIDNAPTS